MGTSLGDGSPALHATKMPRWSNPRELLHAAQENCTDFHFQGFEQVTNGFWDAQSTTFAGQMLGAAARGAHLLMMVPPHRSLKTIWPTGSKPIALALFFIAVVPMVSAQTHPLDLDVEVQSGYTNNVNLTKEKDSDIPVEVNTAFRYRSISPELNGLIEGRVGYTAYMMSNASDQLQPNVHGNLLWRLDPERWSWTMDGSWQQQRLDQLGPNSPGNLENQANIWTGPNYRARLSSVTTLSAEARIGYQYNSETTDNSARLGAALRLITKKSDTLSLSGNIEAQAARRQGDGDSMQSNLADFDFATVYVGYSRQDGHARTYFEIGGSSANVKNAQDESGLFFRLDTSTKLPGRSRGGLRLFSGYTFEGEAARSGAPEPDIESPIETAALGLFYESSGRFYYDISGKRSRFIGVLYAWHRDYFADMNDESDFGGTLSVSRSLTRLSKGSIFVDAKRQDLDEVSSENRDYTFGLQVSRRLSRKLSAAAQLRYTLRTSNDPSEEFDETAIYFSLRRKILP